MSLPCWVALMTIVLTAKKLLMLLVSKKRHLRNSPPREDFLHLIHVARPGQPTTRCPCSPPAAAEYRDAGIAPLDAI